MATTDSAQGVDNYADDPLARVAQLVRGEYLEMPGLSLTFKQAMRLWNLDQARCQRVLEQLVRSGFLIETRHGLFRRLERSS